MITQTLAAGLIALTPAWPQPTYPQPIEPPLLTQNTHHKYICEPDGSACYCVGALPEDPAAILGECPKVNPGSRYGGVWAAARGSGRRDGGQIDAAV